MSFEKFHYPTPDGGEIVLPYMDKLPGSAIRKNRKLDPMDFMYTLVEIVADEAALEKLDSLSLGEQNKFFEAWQGATAPVGESSRSSI
jgi:hypothetical protein